MDSCGSSIIPFCVETKTLRQPGPGKLKSASFGGCSLRELFDQLPAARFDHVHFWRATIPGLASQPTPLHSTVPCGGKTFRLLQREMEKPLYRRISEDHYDVMVFDVAQDFATNHVVKGGTIFPDFRDVIEADEPPIDFSSMKELESYDSVSADSDLYWDIWFSCFAKLHSEILEPRHKAGSKIFFVERYLCETSLSNGSFFPHPNVERSRRANRRLRAVYERLSATPGIRLLRVHEKLFFTSRDAPWGDWELHPEREFYFQMKTELLRLVEPQLAAEASAEWLLEQAAERSAMRAERDAAQSAARDMEDAAREMDRLRLELARAQDDLQGARERLARAESESWLEKYLGEADASGARARSVFNRLLVWLARSHEMRRLRRAKFDSAAYLLRYRDVAAAGVDPLAHYVRHGRREGRLATFRS